MMTGQGANAEKFSYAPFSGIAVERLINLHFHHDLSATSSTPGNDLNRWKWDKLHVRLPCALQNITRAGESLWSIIQNDFGCSYFTSGQVLGEKIKSYSGKHSRTWGFNCLEEFSKQDPDLFRTVVPEIIDLAKKLPELIQKPIPILRANQEGSVTLNQMQIASLLANAFLCTFPWRNDPKESGGLPSINFNGLFEQRDQSSVEKLKCIFHYFSRVSEKGPTGKVTFSRRVLKPQLHPDWRKSSQLLLPLKITESDYIEDAEGMLQVVFANKAIGGEVLGQGAVQEGIRFVMSPELIVARLFTEELQGNEAMVITGTERFNKHSGYSKTFRYEGDFQDDTPFDEDGRRKCSIVAIDAIHFRNPGTQYSIDNVNRELIKAYSGFRLQCDQPNQLSPVATGNWGCGAFNGDPRLKALIQLMAASQAGRQLRYFTRGDQKLVKEMTELCFHFDAFGVKTVGALHEMLQIILPSRPNNLLAAISRLSNSEKEMDEFVHQHTNLVPPKTSYKAQQSTGGLSSYTEQRQVSNERQEQNQHQLESPNPGKQSSTTQQTQGRCSNRSHGNVIHYSTPTLTVTESGSSKLNPDNSEVDPPSEGSTLVDATDGLKDFCERKKNGPWDDIVNELKSKFHDQSENASDCDMNEQKAMPHSALSGDEAQKTNCYW